MINVSWNYAITFYSTKAIYSHNLQLRTHQSAISIDYGNIKVDFYKPYWLIMGFPSIFTCILLPKNFINETTNTHQRSSYTPNLLCIFLSYSHIHSCIRIWTLLII